MALLNVAYKLLARVIHQRLAPELDPHIMGEQFGFRAGRSSSHPIFMSRRAMEECERQELKVT
eukprot:2547529-Amphidinium_carterae.1